MDSIRREDWRKGLLSDDNWQAHLPNAAKPIEEGEAGGFLVRSEQTGQLGYLKPRKKKPDEPRRAAYEKIASDLAYEIGVNVPSVLLHRRPMAPIDEVTEVAVSLAASTFYEWNDLFEINSADGGTSGLKKGVNQLLRDVLGRASGTVALDAWLTNKDRRHPRNAGLAYDDDSGGRLFFLDFANSMDFDGGWGRGDDQAFGKVDVPPFFASCMSRDRVRIAAERVEHMQDATVEEIILRVPDDFLATERKAFLVPKLIARKKRLLEAFDHWYPGP